MQLAAKLIGAAGLAVSLGASLAYATGGLGLDDCKAWLLAATIVWFAAAAAWTFADKAGPAEASAE